MVKAIHRKLARDIWHLRSQAVAIALVMACGVATFVMSLSMLDSLTGTLDAYYEQNRFADVFAQMKRAPQSLAARIAEIPGVAAVDTRVVERVTLDMPGMVEPASGQIVSLPVDPRDGLNLLYLRSGRYPEGRGGTEVLLSQRFAEAHDLRSGDEVQAVLNGRLESLRVVGVALSPEFIYLIAPGSILPENRRFGVFWMQRREMEAAFDMEGAFNDVLVRLMPGASEVEVIARLDELTEQYGGLGAYGRDDQRSHKFVANEIRELRAMTLIVPVIFVSVAAFLQNIVMSRMIATQREQIAVMKALGYSTVEIGMHYYGFVLLIAAISVIVGTAGGAWMGRGLTAMYASFYDFPTFNYTLHPMVVLFGAVISVGAASIGAAWALWSAMWLPPAEAMRPPAPATYRPTILERIGMHRFLPPSVRMVLRHLERRPVKTGLSVLGIAMAAAILVVGSYSEDAVDYIMDFQFQRVQRYDVDVVMTEQTDDSGLSTIRHMTGVVSMQPYRSVAVRLRSGHLHRRTGILGLTSSDGLYRLLDVNGEQVDLPDSGIILSTTLSDILQVAVGDEVTVEALQGRRPTFRTTVAGIMEDFSGLSAYMNIRELNELMREQHTMTGAYIVSDAARSESLYRELRETPRVVAVNVKSATVAAFEQTIAEMIGMMRSFLIGFSVIIACGVVYNSARISLSEKARDFATLRVIGFTRGEISAIQLGEQAILTGVAIPAGLVLGYFLAWVVSNSSDSELIRIPFVVYPSTFVLAAIVVIIASIVSGLIVRRRLDRLDLVSALKSRE